MPRRQSQTNAGPPAQSKGAYVWLHDRVNGSIVHAYCLHVSHLTWLKSIHCQVSRSVKPHPSMERNVPGPDPSLLIFQQHYLESPHLFPRKFTFRRQIFNFKNLIKDRTPRMIWTGFSMASPLPRNIFTSNVSAWRIRSSNEPRFTDPGFALQDERLMRACHVTTPVTP